MEHLRPENSHLWDLNLELSVRHDPSKGLPLPSPTNKKYSGKFQLRLGSELHKVISLKAMQTGDSLNDFCVKMLKQSLAPNQDHKR